MEERTCPTCNVELIIDEVFDGDFGISTREEEWYGHCPQCKQYCRWTDVYTYKETKNFEVYVDEDA